MGESGSFERRFSMVRDTAYSYKCLFADAKTHCIIFFVPLFVSFFLCIGTYPPG